MFNFKKIMPEVTAENADVVMSIMNEIQSELWIEGGIVENTSKLLYMYMENTVFSEKYKNVVIDNSYSHGLDPYTMDCAATLIEAVRENLSNMQDVFDKYVDDLGKVFDHAVSKRKIEEAAPTALKKSGDVVA